MFIIVTLLAVALFFAVNYYLAHRAWRLIHHFIPKLTLTIPLLLFWIMTVMMLLSFFRPFGGRLQQYISIIGAVWMGVLVYLLIFFLLSDLAVGIVRLFRALSASAMARLRLISGITALIMALSVSIYGIINARIIKTTEYDIKLSDAPTSSLTLALISDVHLGAVGSESRLEHIVAEINGLKPDLVCIAGDLFDTDFTSIVDPEKAIEALRGLRSTYGTYACLGNHDAGETLADMEDFLKRANIHLLKDSYVTINDSLILAGRLDPSPIGGFGSLSRVEPDEVLKGADRDLPIVMLDHNPASIDSYRGDVGLVLSGHTHKGQIFPGSVFTNAIYTVDYGYYRSEHGTQAVVTSGVGTWGLPMRVGTDCEIVRIALDY